MKNKVFSLINILGLTIGITVCMMIFLFIMNEYRFDQFHAQGQNIYRVVRIIDNQGAERRVPWLSAPYATALLNDYPDAVKKAVRVKPVNALASFGNKAFNEKKVYLADAGFFTFFSFPLLKGNPATALSNPGSVVLTESTARKYFGDQDPMGKVLEIDKQLPLTVTGIAKDVPSNSHLDFDLVVPLSNYAREDWFQYWIHNSLYTYVLLDEHTQAASLEKRFPAFINKYMGESLSRIGLQFQLGLTPLSAIHFEPAIPSDLTKHGDKTTVYIFLSVALLILLIACINFMNLSTIRAAERSKEVGLRKVMGAMRKHLTWQFIGESIILTLISCVLSLVLLQWLMPLYNRLLENNLTVSWMAAPIYFFIAGIILVVGLLAGSYPAFFLSSFSPIQALKGKLQTGKGGVWFRQALVVVQFSISVLLIIGTVVVSNQMKYMKTKELGYNKEHTIVVRLDDNNDIFNGRYHFKHALQGNPYIRSVSLMSGEPGGFYDTQTFKVEGTDEQIWSFKTEFADFEYVNTLHLEIIAGRNFSAQFPTDTATAALINRTAAKRLGYSPEQAVGRWIQNTLRDNSRRRIIGVVEDFNFLSLKDKMEPLVIAPNEDIRVALVRLQPGGIRAGIKAIQDQYGKLAAAYPFEYSFLDQNFDRLYKKDIRQQRLLNIFSGLAIFIACLGLFGLASFTTARRIKEIGVRKVLGASAKSIVLLLSRDLLKPVLLAALIAIPLGYYAMNNWLQHFAYHTPLQWWVFALAAAITSGIAWLTIGFQSVRAALMNPVKALQSE